MRPTFENGLNLAYWLYKVHPELYAKIRPIATKARARLGSLGDDFLPGISTFDSTNVDTFEPLPVEFDPGTFDVGTDSFTFDAGSNPIADLSPDIAAISAPDLSAISVDTSGMTVPTFQTDTGSSFFDAIGQDLRSVGSWLTSATGLSTVGNIASTVLKANTPQQQTVQTQVARVAAGSNPAAITYGYNTAGQVVPILQTGVNQGKALTPATLASFLPSSLQKYATPISVGIAALIVVGLMRRARR